jgi:RNA polymerase sigma-70 factor (ECF subfamily)
MSEATDEDLMLAYGRGDARAFEELYGRYRGPLYRYFLRQVREAALANDLYQGCWEKVIAARRKYSDRAPFKAWLFRIAHNHLVDHFRATRPTTELSDDTPGDDEDPGDSLDEAQRQAQFRQALEALPREQREALVLRLETGLGVDEIGRITGVGAETAKSRLRYAIAKLKQVMQE